MYGRESKINDSNLIKIKFFLKVKKNKLFDSACNSAEMHALLWKRKMTANHLMDIVWLWSICLLEVI